MSKKPSPLAGTEAVKFSRRKSMQDIMHDEHGREILDPTPMQPPLGYKKHESLSEQIRRMIVSEKLKQEAEAAGFESFEEADDFDIGDDYDPYSPYEEVFEGIPAPAGGEAPEAPKAPPAPPAPSSTPPGTPPAGSLEPAPLPPKGQA